MLQVLVAISQKFCCRKETWGYAKVIHKKEKKLRKNGQVSKIFKKWVLRCPSEKKIRDE
jgi:ABC-type amino acid transport substrate-binding protein